MRPAELAPCYADEVRRWREDLQWDFASSIDQIEAGRRDGRVGGYVARDASGAIQGWTYFVVNQRTLQIGAITAQTVEQLRALLDRVLRSPEADAAQDLTCFVYPRTAGLSSALERRRFTLLDFCYMTADAAALARRAGSGDASDSELRPWSLTPGPAAVRLMARAYAGEPVARWFAPHGRLDEWAHYVGQLLHTTACGTFLPEASFALDGDAGEPAGLVLTTQLSGTMAHVAQVVSDPEVRRRGIATRLVAAAARAVLGIGCEACSLLVADDNAPAKALYASLGFVERGRFVSARRAPLRRVLGGHAALLRGAATPRSKAS